jgi:extracellular factor (EF) 3-hydroxypalmitic acid methyl ester biosynthesis protein
VPQLQVTKDYLWWMAPVEQRFAPTNLYNPVSHVKSSRPIDPVVTFRNSQGEAARGTLTSAKRRALVMEIYNPYSIVQVSEVLSDLVVRSGERSIYSGRAIVSSLLNTGLMAVVSLALVDEWSDLNIVQGDVSRVSDVAQNFVDEWESRFKINRSYQVAISEMRAFLSEASRWADQADMSESLPRGPDKRLRDDVFEELAVPLMKKGSSYFEWLEDEASRVSLEDSPMHRSFAQSALHPLLLRAPFIYRTFAKPMGYAGDYEMVNQILDPARQGENTYFQIVNSFFLKADVAQAHRNRIDILVERLKEAAKLARQLGRQIRVLNVGCGPAVEIQRFIEQDPEPDCLSFTLVDFSEQTLEYTRSCFDSIARKTGKKTSVEIVNESVHELLKRASRPDETLLRTTYDLVYCAGLFDYLTDKVCARLLVYFNSRSHKGGKILVTNVHSRNPHKYVMEHVMEWHLIYRNEKQLENVLPLPRGDTRLYVDKTGVNVFAEFAVS